MCVDVTTLCWVGLGREVAYYGRYMCSVGWGNDHSISRLPSPADQTPDLSGDSHRHPPAGVRVSNQSTANNFCSPLLVVSQLWGDLWRPADSLRPI